MDLIFLGVERLEPQRAEIMDAPCTRTQRT
jgi:hypothetical protein